MAGTPLDELIDRYATPIPQQEFLVEEWRLYSCLDDKYLVEVDCISLRARYDFGLEVQLTQGQLDYYLKTGYWKCEPS
jgi:hypothetical protein